MQLVEYGDSEGNHTKVGHGDREVIYTLVRYVYTKGNHTKVGHGDREGNI